MITRDTIQGFIDGHKLAGHSDDCLKSCAKKWLKEHPLYKPDEAILNQIIDDLSSYRK